MDRPRGRTLTGPAINDQHPVAGATLVLFFDQDEGPEQTHEDQDQGDCQDRHNDKQYSEVLRAETRRVIGA
jgi:hypothetical protein